MTCGPTLLWRIIASIVMIWVNKNIHIFTQSSIRYSMQYTASCRSRINLHFVRKYSSNSQTHIAMPPSDPHSWKSDSPYRESRCSIQVLHYDEAVLCDDKNSWTTRRDINKGSYTHEQHHFTMPYQNWPSMHHLLISQIHDAHSCPWNRQ